MIIRLLVNVECVEAYGLVNGWLRGGSIGITLYPLYPRSLFTESLMPQMLIKVNKEEDLPAGLWFTQLELLVIVERIGHLGE